MHPELSDPEMVASTTRRGPPPPPDTAPALDAAEDEQSALRAALLASRPTMQPVPVKVAAELAEALNAVSSAVAGPDAPPIAPVPEATLDDQGKPVKSLSGGIPDDLFLIVAALAKLLIAAEGGSYAKKYDLNPADLADEKGTKATTRALEALAKNKKCIKAIQALMGPPPGEGPSMEKDPAPPPPMDSHPLSETGRALASSMP